MAGIIRSELLKMRHTFSMRIVIFAPIVTLQLGYLLSGDYVQLSAYNWWYAMILPLVVSICSASMISREQKSGMQNVICLPIQYNQIWFSKTAALVILLLVTNLFMWIAVTAVGFATSMTVSPLDGLIGCMLLFLTYLWQIPFIMLLTGSMGYLLTILISMAANVLLSAVCAETKWFFIVPYAIPARVVCPFFKLHVNGIPLENGSPLLSDVAVLPAAIISLVLALVVFCGSANLFLRGEWLCERILALSKK